MKKKEYITPICARINVEIHHMLASSITANSFTGSGPDSDDFEFGVPARSRRDQSTIWENEWE